MEAKHTKWGAAILAAALVAITSTKDARAADGAPVVLGEVGTRVTRANVDLPLLLRRALERELARLPALRARAKHYVLSASLVTLDDKISGQSGTVQCAVSAVLRDAKSGAIYAILEGRARTEHQGEAGPAELGAVEAAARGAVASLPDAIR
jgi:hypothetical protein